MTDDQGRPTDEDLRAMPGPAGPSPGLEERVVAALRAQGLLAPRQGGHRLWLVAAGLVCFVFGWALRGQVERREAASDGSLYLLLLSELSERADSSAEAQRVEEYRSWAIELRRQGRLVRAEKLGAESHALGAKGETAPTRASGFFLIRAASIEEALALARGCPHLLHGGSITVQPVDAT